MSEARDAALSQIESCDTLLDLGGSDAALAAELYKRFDCAIQVADLDASGNFLPEDKSALGDYLAALKVAGVPEDRIKIARSLAALRNADVVLSLGTFGDRWKIKHSAPFLRAGLHADSVLLIDIRKGSGAFPFLKSGFGTTEIIADLDGPALRRVLLRPHPPAPEADEGWAEIARGLAGEDGFFRDGPNGHSFLYVPRNKDVLVVTFDNLDIAMNKRDDRRPWGYDFIARQGWSMLGVLAGGWTWYREPWVSEQFDELRDSGFFSQFGRVVFYGASMGGYAAAAFSSASPGADVVAISPQSTLDKTIVPWETRYRTAWHYDYNGPYGDAAKVSDQARRVTLLYDPYEPLDSGHAKRFTGDNVVKLRCPLMGHRLGSSLSQMGLLSPTILAALDGSLEPADFYRALRARHVFPRYQKELFQRAVARKRYGQARQVARWVLARGDNPSIRKGLAALPETDS